MKITIRNLQKKIPITPRRIKKAILRVLSAERLSRAGEITVCFVNDSKIKELNKKYLKKDRATDVLAFDLSRARSKELCADIVVSTDTACHNAALFNTRPDYEICLYVIHGVLHLLGYDDHTPAQKKLIRKKENFYVY